MTGKKDEASAWWTAITSAAASFDVTGEFEASAGSGAIVRAHDIGRYEKTWQPTS